MSVIIQELIRNLLTIDMFIAMVIGICGGMVIGILPGLGPSIGCALLIPISYAMEPIAGIAMLMALYTSSIYGGSFTSILLHTPGTPASAATCEDGYALTLQGRSLEAISWSTISSCTGGVISGIVLIMLAPPLAKLAVRFNDPEVFWIAIFGLTIIGSLAGDSIIKGLISGILGIILGCIGMDGAVGALRFTFGIKKLYSGIDQLPVMIGLFSISQVLILCEDIKNANKSLVKKNDKQLSGKFTFNYKEIVNQLGNIFRSSFIGTLIGILPGAGANIGCWVSYNEAKRVSKNPEEFGKGSVSAIVASEAANNAVTGGAFVPLLTMGIPGSPVAAIILSALLLHGLIPGNRLFTQQASITYSIIVAFIISNILMGILAYLIIPYVTKIVFFPISIIAPCIVVLSLLGVYATKLSIFEVWLMLIFGLIAYIMRKVEIPPAPLILGLILGPMAEDAYIRTLTLAKGQHILKYFISRPICIILMVLVILGLFFPLLVKVFMKKGKTKAIND